MNCRKLTTNMMVRDVNETAHFYRDVLDFTFVMGAANHEEVAALSDAPLDFAMLKNGPVEMMFQSPASLGEDVPALAGHDIGASLTFYIEVDDVEALADRLKNKVRILKEPQTMFYGMKEFYIEDCNGYILAFAQKV